MLGLINRSFQCFLTDTYGAVTWAKVVGQAGLLDTEFEAMLTYEDQVTEALLLAGTIVLTRPRETLLEDLGNYLISHPNVQSLRRLLRFGGATFLDMLHSMEDLRERGHMAVPDLDLPRMEVTDLGQGNYRLTCSHPVSGAGFVIMGLMRAMADDFGALVLLEHEGISQGIETLRVQLLDQSFSQGRHFELAQELV
jgi:hypothetical protein